MTQYEVYTNQKLLERLTIEDEWLSLEEQVDKLDRLCKPKVRKVKLKPPPF